MIMDLGKKILHNLDAILATDLEIDEYDFVVTPYSSSNRNPLLHENHKVAVEAWAAKQLYSYAYSRVLQHRLDENSPKGHDVLLSLTRCVLMINPDCMTAWNIRKELIKGNRLSCKDDLRLGKLILTKHPKSPETFAHRKWVLERFQKTDAICKDELDSRVEKSDHGTNDEELLKQRVADETEVCLCAADRYPNNYNAWSHRIWLLQQFGAKRQMLESELGATRQFVSSHVSDHSGFHYRQYALHALNQCMPASDWIRLARDDLDLTSDLITSYPGHEAVWYHRRAILHQMISKLSSSAVPSCDVEIKRRRPDDPLEELSRQEDTFVQDILRTKKSLAWQETLAERHKRWLSTCLPASSITTQ